MFDGILTINQFISKKTCKKILNRCKKNLELSPAEISDGVLLEKRKSSVAFLTNIDEIDNKLKNFLKKTIILKGGTVTGIGPYQFTEYKDNDFYDWHIDSNDYYKNRFCSVVIQLNDDYSGGNLELKDKYNNTIVLQSEAGNLHLFYSNILHRVTPITNGTRYSLVNWVSIEPIKNYKKTII